MRCGRGTAPGRISGSAEIDPTIPFPNSFPPSGGGRRAPPRRMRPGSAGGGRERRGAADPTDGQQRGAPGPGSAGDPGDPGAQHRPSRFSTGLVDRADPHDLHPVPGQAESWEISADGLTYTFHLRANLRWSNGEPLTAGDFIQSYRRLLTSLHFAAEYAYLLATLIVKGAQEYNEGKLTDFSQVGFQAPDDRTLVISLKQATPFLLKVMACHYVWDAVPVKTIAQFGPVEEKGSHWTRAGNLVASGPFLLKEWTPNKRIVVARNPYYWDAARVKLDGIEFYPIDDPAPSRSGCSAPARSTSPMIFSRTSSTATAATTPTSCTPIPGSVIYYYNMQRHPPTLHRRPDPPGPRLGRRPGRTGEGRDAGRPDPGLRHQLSRRLRLRAAGPPRGAAWQAAGSSRRPAIPRAGACRPSSSSTTPTRRTTGRWRRRSRRCGGRTSG